MYQGKLRPLAALLIARKPSGPPQMVNEATMRSIERRKRAEAKLKEIKEGKS